MFNSLRQKEASEATEEVVEAAKTILADDVLARIDEIGKTYFDELGKTSFADIISSYLTEEQKLVKPKLYKHRLNKRRIRIKHQVAMRQVKQFV